MAKGTATNFDTKTDFQEALNADDDSFQRVFSVNSKKNSGIHIYGSNNRIKLKICTDNKFNILSEIDTSSGEESSQCSGSDNDNSSSRKSNKNDNVACDEGRRKEAKTKSESLKLRRLNKTKSSTILNDDIDIANKNECKTTVKESNKKETKKLAKKSKRVYFDVDVSEESCSCESNDVRRVKAETESKPLDADKNSGTVLFENSKRHPPRRFKKPAGHPSTSGAPAEDEYESKEKSTKPRKLFAPVRIAIIQMMCYGVCLAVGLLMDWPQWILPYMCYIIFVLINLMACVSCVKFKFVKPIKDDTDGYQDDDTELFIWFGIGVIDVNFLCKLISLFLVVSVGFLSSKMFGCAPCVWTQTIVLFIMSTSPYFALEKKLVLKVLQDHCDVFKEFDSQRLLNEKEKL